MRQIEIPNGNASVVFTDRSDGALGHNPPRRSHDDECCGEDVQFKRSKVHAHEWFYVKQVHGNNVVVVANGDSIVDVSRIEADALVTIEPGLTLAIATADCCPIALSCSEGIVAAVHGGWRGLNSGIVDATANKMRELGATKISAVLGPCIHVECYEFDVENLEGMSVKFGNSVAGRDRFGKSSLDLVELVKVSCLRNEIELLNSEKECTACSGNYFSYRAGKDEGRQVMLVWR